MNPLAFPLLADENIHRAVILELRHHGKDVLSVHDEGLTGRSDADILCRAHELGRVVLTHDSDFGKLAVHAHEPFVGIIYLRPGHLSTSFVLNIIAAIEAGPDDVEPPFLLVAERRETIVRIRVRQSAP